MIKRLMCLNVAAGKGQTRPVLGLAVVRTFPWSTIMHMLVKVIFSLLSIYSSLIVKQTYYSTKCCQED